MTQIANAIAPPNCLLTNPEALRAAVESRGVTLARGGLNALDDLRHRRPLPSSVDESEFEVGGNLAVTPGSVVWRTEMFELIQYAPQTDDVYAVPVLIVPSIVNKFYVFDLAPERSVIEYLVQQGFTVFVLAWRNPGKRHDRWGMAEYQAAVLAGIDLAREIRGTDRVNLWAVCGAGPVAVSAAAYLEAIGEQKVNSLLLVVSPLDTAAMSEAPGIGAFLDADEPAAPEPVARAVRSRRLSARDFAVLFAMLRSNEMIWSFWVSGYLLGKPPPAFDVLYWNADGTGMTAQFNHDFSTFVDENPFLASGAMSVQDTPIADLGSLSFDSYVLGAKTDHLCIWQAVYRSAQLLGPESLFVLGNSGHIQTIVSPPGNPRASFRSGPASHESPADWLAASEEHAGSWWPHYVDWLAKRSGDLVTAPGVAGDEAHPVIDAAPGLYVHERV
jgi:polyhydroxyalkanoate synthase